MSAPTVPVVMCTWKRPENLVTTIATLKQQKGVKPHLYIWNNNLSIRKIVDDVVAGTDLPVTVIHSESNVGGFGRFYYAKQLANTYPYIIFIDDDQLLEEDSLAVLWSEAQPKTVI